MSTSWRTIRPWVGRTIPEHALNVVVFPAPFGPMSPVIVPARTARLTLSTATAPP